MRGYLKCYECRAEIREIDETEYHGMNELCDKCHAKFINLNGILGDMFLNFYK